MPEFNDLIEKVEEALAIVIRAAATGIPDGQVLTSFSDQTETIGPYSITVQCLGGPEDGHNSGNYRVSASVRVMCNADAEPLDAANPGTPRRRHRAYVAKTFDALKQSDLHSSLTAAVAGFTVFDSIKRSHGPSRMADRKFVSEMGLEFTCNAVDLAE